MVTDVLGNELKVGNIVAIAVKDKLLEAKQTLATIISIIGEMIEIRYFGDTNINYLIKSTSRVVKVS